jgi:hypothetical protein
MQHWLKTGAGMIRRGSRFPAQIVNPALGRAKILVLALILAPILPPILAVTLVGVAATPALADTPKNLGAFAKWRALTATAEGQRTCYALSIPVEKKGTVAGRGEAAAMVTHFPEIGALDQVSIVLGFEPASNSPVIAKIGGFTFTLDEVAGDRAWVKGRANDRAMVQALKKSNRMVVTASTAKGLKVEDTYDLTGFTKAYQAMSKACS